MNPTQADIISKNKVLVSCPMPVSEQNWKHLSTPSYSEDGSYGCIKISKSATCVPPMHRSHQKNEAPQCSRSSSLLVSPTLFFTPFLGFIGSLDLSRQGAEHHLVQCGLHVHAHLDHGLHDPCWGLLKEELQPASGQPSPLLSLASLW